MKFKVLLNDSEIIEAPDHQEIVAQLSRLAWADDSVDLDGYMKNVSKRMLNQKHVQVRFCCPKHFVEGLERAGALEAVK